MRMLNLNIAWLMELINQANPQVTMESQTQEKGRTHPTKMIL